MPDNKAELWSVQHLALLTGVNITNIRDAKSDFGPGETGIDVAFDLNGRRLGAQHTVFHFDEGQVPGKRGSPARAVEETTARATKTSFGMWANPDYRPALARRISEKIALASRYPTRDLVAETWLIVSASLNRWGAAASTIIMPHAVRVEDLNRLFHEDLASSNFNQAFLILHLNSIGYGWEREAGWRLIADPDAGAREQHHEEYTTRNYRLGRKRSTEPFRRIKPRIVLRAHS
jgi:hypothetical protein